MSSMNVCIWYETTTAPWGGANSFLRTLAESLRSDGDEVHDRPRRDSSVILLNSWSRGQDQFLTYKEIRRLRENAVGVIGRLRSAFSSTSSRPVLIHRLDGIARLYGRHDNADEVQMEINRLTDCTIFQSEYCQRIFQEGGVMPEHHQVVHNGVDTRLFYPDHRHRPAGKKLKLLCASWSSNPKKGFAQLAELARLKGVEVTFIGNWCDSVDPGFVRLLGVKEGVELAALLRNYDAFVHAAENDPCPNAVLEALSSGLPVLYRNSGGTPELARRYGVSMDVGLQNAVDQLVDSYSDIRERLLDECSRFDISRVAGRYREIFVQTLERRVHG